MSTSNYLKRIAFVGAGGNSGSYMVEALLKTGKHAVTAITREGSTSKLPKGVDVAHVNYDNLATITKALKGHDALIITLGGRAPPDHQSKLIQAAAEAGVHWIMPNEFSPDTASEELLNDIPIFGPKKQAREEIEKTGVCAYISLVTGFWYEWSLAIPAAYGCDFGNRTMTFFDEGETRASTSTWQQVGRAVAGLLSLPVKAEGGDKERCLENFKNKVVYVSSFTVTQKEMFASVLRVTGTKESDWKISKEPAVERYKTGSEAMKSGDHIGFAKMLYTRIYFPDGTGNFETNKGTVNALLGLPTEDVDEATKRAEKRSETDPWG
ncbi:hypothetical protein B0A50_03571 [Salinomyces thailandicus]|uniref:NmrA-like domain-containing protein n=1 Tax=Salinomyces thailandicus TaxID=706561 RepID=A0A4U0U3Q7_9PEZI|nr:hypothetical protein B0A50_03571 [Salinomyces thailandica]